MQAKSCVKGWSGIIRKLTFGLSLPLNDQSAFLVQGMKEILPIGLALMSNNNIMKKNLVMNLSLFLLNYLEEEWQVS